MNSISRITITTIISRAQETRIESEVSKENHFACCMTFMKDFMVLNVCMDHLLTTNLPNNKNLDNGFKINLSISLEIVEDDKSSIAIDPN